MLTHDLTKTDAPRRYERKFRVDGVHPQAIQAVIQRQPGCFSPIYHPRLVNSLYLDTATYQARRDNEEGQTLRLKVRLRWYDHCPDNQLQLELKWREGLIVRKLAYPLQLPSGIELADPEALLALVQQAQLPPLVSSAMQGLFPALYMSYTRYYSLSACKKYRLTLDLDVRAKAARLPCPWQPLPCNVIELKYAPEDDPQAHQALNLPWRLDRHSKYILGLQITQSQTPTTQVPTPKPTSNNP